MLTIQTTSNSRTGAYDEYVLKVSCPSAGTASVNFTFEPSQLTLKRIQTQSNVDTELPITTGAPQDFACAPVTGTAGVSTYRIRVYAAADGKHEGLHFSTIVHQMAGCVSWDHSLVSVCCPLVWGRRARTAFLCSLLECDMPSHHRF